VKQKKGILPNFVHSMDAAHLVATARLAKSKGITALSAVHDAFATHAADLETLQQCIRDGFLEVYPSGHSHLNHFVAWCHALAGLPPGVGQGLPPVTFGATEQRLLGLAETLRVVQPVADAATSKKKDGGKQAAATPQRMPEQDWIEKVRESAYFFS
jgi:hypothetical protein